MKLISCNYYLQEPAYFFKVEEEERLRTVRWPNRENACKLHEVVYLEGKKKVGGRGAIVPVLFSEEAVEAIAFWFNTENIWEYIKGTITSLPVENSIWKDGTPCKVSQSR